MTLITSERMELFQRFKEKDIDKLIKLSVVFKANKNFEKAHIADVLIKIKSQDIDGLKVMIKELSRSGATMEADYADSLLQEQLSIKANEKKQAKKQKMETRLAKKRTALPGNTSPSKPSSGFSEEVYEAMAKRTELNSQRHRDRIGKLQRENKAIMQEVKNLSQHPGEPFRRWFYDDIFDLIVWYDQGQRIIGFQLCYHEGADHKALTWHHDTGFTHEKIDDGEGRPFRAKMAPILLPDGVFKRDHILSLFEKASRNIDPGIVDVITETIRRYPDN